MTIQRTPSDTSAARSGLALWLIVLAFWFASAATAGTVVYEDSTFNDADWSFRFIDFGFVEIQIPTDRQFLAGGNPDAYREIHIKIPPSISDRWGLFGVYSKAGATYEPSTQGPIEAIQYSEDAVNLSTSGQQIGLSIIQEYPDEDPPFVAIYAALDSVTETAWTRKSLRNLKANDFFLIDGGIVNINAHPDFSASGGRMTFGYVRGRDGASPLGASLDLLAGIDNWRVEVESTSNDAPVADAGPDQFWQDVPPVISLDGSKSTDPAPGPSPLTYTWTQISGPAVLLGTSGSSAVFYTTKEVAIYEYHYEFDLVVSDGSTSSIPDRVSIHMLNPTKCECNDSCFIAQFTCSQNCSRPTQRNTAKITALNAPAAELSSILRTYRGVRDKLLAATTDGQRFIRLYQEHSPEMSALLLSNPELIAKTEQMLSTLQPIFDALLADRGAAVVITAEHTQAIESFMDTLAAEGSPALRDAITAERTRWGPLKNYEGQSMAEAQNNLLGHGVFLPRLTNP